MALVFCGLGAGQVLAGNECGPAGGSPLAVTCTSAGNPYSSGIFYAAGTDMALTLNSDVNAAYTGTTGAVQVNAFGGSALLAANAATINSSTGNFVRGLDAFATDGNATVTSSGTINVANGYGIESRVNGSAATLASVVYSGPGVQFAGFQPIGILAWNFTANGGAMIDASGDISGSVQAGASRPTALWAEAMGDGNALVHYRSGTINVQGNSAVGIFAAPDGAGSGEIIADSGTTIIINGTNPGDSSPTQPVKAAILIQAPAATAAGGATVTVTAASNIKMIGAPNPDPSIFNNPVGIRASVSKDAPLSVTYTGPGISTVGGGGFGILAISGSGSIAVNSSGPITTNGVNALGIVADSGTIRNPVPGLGGPVTVTALGAISTQGSEAHGIWAASTTGPVTVDATRVMTTGVFSAGIRAAGASASVHVASGGMIMGGWQPLATGVGAAPDFTLPSAGVVLSATTGPALLINDGTIGALSDRAVYGDPQIVNNGVMTGFVQLTAGVNDYVNNGVFNLRQFADTDGNGTRDTVRVAVSDLGPGTTSTFENSGTLALQGGANATTLDSTGQYLPLGTPANAMALNGPVQGHLLGVGTFTNTGTIDLQANPAAGDVLLVSGGHMPGSNGGGTFVSNGGRLLIDTILDAGGPASRSDVLVVDRAAVGAGGATRIFVHNAGGAGALTTGDGILVVKAAGNGATAPGAFHLGNVVAAGPYEYLLFHGGLSAGTDNNWYLRNEPGPIPPDPPIPPNPGPGPTPPQPGPTPPQPTPPQPQPTPLPNPEPGPTPPEPGPTPPPYYRMEAPLYSKITLLARQVNLLLLGSFHERRGDQDLLHDDGNLWGRLIGADVQQKFTGPLVPSFNGTVGGAQLGADAYVFDNRADRLGGFVSYAHTGGTVRGTILDDADQLGGDLPEDAIALAGYYTHVAPAGWYAEAVLMGSWFNAYPLSERGVSTHTTGSGITVSAEAGYPFALDPEWTLEPMAQLFFNSLSFSSTSDPFTTLDFHPASTWYGRLGTRLEYGTTVGDTPVKPFIEIDIWHGFGGTDTTIYNGDIAVPIPFGNTDLETALGITSQVSDSLALNARVGYLGSLEGNYQQVLKGQIGLRYLWL